MFSVFDELTTQGSDIIELCHGQTKGGHCFHAFIKMPLSDYLRYRRALKKGGAMDLTDYGAIIHSGWGREPSEETKARIMRDHTDNHKIAGAMAGHASAMRQIIVRNAGEGAA